MNPVAIAAVEVSSIAQGAVVGDAMVKTAVVELLRADTLSPGRYWVLIGGDVATVRASLKRGIEVAAETLLDSLFIPQLHPQILPALTGTVPADSQDSLGILETLTAVSAIEAADVAAKAANVTVRDLRLADGIGGKGVVYLTGALSDIQAAVSAGREGALSRGLLARSVIVPRLHPQMRERMF